MPSMIRVTSNAQEYLGELKRITGGLQHVTAATLTDTAQAVTVRSERNIRREMIVRTPYTTKSLRTYKASPSRPIARQDAVSGTVSEYLPIQDEGGTIRARKRKIAVPTNKVRGKARKRRIPARYRIDAMGDKAFVLRPTTKSKDDAANWGMGTGRKKHMIFGRRRGGKMVAYRLSRAGLFIRRNGKLEHVRDIEESSYRLKARRWHSEAVARYGTYNYMAGVFRREARRYLGAVAS